jgi:membrane-bound ClpP family serine protease
MLDKDGWIDEGKKALKDYQEAVVPRWKGQAACILLLLYVAFYFVLFRFSPNLNGWGILGILGGSLVLCLIVLGIARYQPESSEQDEQENE